MKTVDFAQLGCRIVAPALFFVSVGTEIMARGRPDLALSVIAGLVCIFAIWMLFGIRTRVAALAALVLWTGWHALGRGIQDQTMMLVILAVLCLPLILRGGGTHALYRRGWSDLV